MATEKRLIDADVVRHNINVHLAGVIHRGIGFIPSGKDSNSAYEFLRGYEEGAKYIANEILQEKYLVDAEEVVHGRWVIHSYGHGDHANNWVECSECGVCGSPHWKRCPVCEAKMDGDGNG